MEILSGDEHADVLTWVPHGKAFIIYKKKKFSAEVLPRYFKQSKFTSFTRKLNRWGFSRVTRGPEAGSYFHKFFLRDQPHLSLQMSCQNVRHHQGQPQSPSTTMDNQLQSQNLSTNMNNIMPYGMGVGTGNNIMSNPNAFMQLQFQQMQHMQQHQHLQNEFMRRAMASQASAGATQAQLLGGVVNSSSADPGTMGGGAAKSNDELLYMQMVAQSKASSLSAQPLMRAIQSSLFQSQHANSGAADIDGTGSGMMTIQNQGEQDSERVVSRASAA